MAAIFPYRSQCGNDDWVTNIQVCRGHQVMSQVAKISQAPSPYFMGWPRACREQPRVAKNASFAPNSTSIWNRPTSGKSVGKLAGDLRRTWGKNWRQVTPRRPFEQSRNHIRWNCFNIYISIYHIEDGKSCYFAKVRLFQS